MKSIKFIKWGRGQGRILKFCLVLYELYNFRFQLYNWRASRRSLHFFEARSNVFVISLAAD